MIVPQRQQTPNAVQVHTDVLNDKATRPATAAAKSQDVFQKTEVQAVTAGCESHDATFELFQAMLRHHAR